MAKQTIQVEVEKETLDVGLLLAGLIKSVKAKKPVAQIAAEELQDLVKAIDGIEQVPAEYKEDKAAFMKAVLIPVSDAVASLMTESPSQPAA